MAMTTVATGTAEIFHYNWTATPQNNTIDIEDGEDDSPYPKIALDIPTIIIITLYGLICLIGLVGNGLVIYVVLRYHRLKTVTNIYILNLSIADGLFLVVLPMLITTAIVRVWVFGSAMCKLYFMLTCINSFTSAFTLTVMAIDRYLATCHPIRSLTYRTAKYAVIALLAIWVLSFLAMFPVILYAQVVHKSCTIQWPKTVISGHVGFIFYNMIIAFVIPVVLICTFYAMIIARLSHGGPGSMAHRRHCQFRKATRLVTLIIAVFIVCWLPHWVMQVYLVSRPMTGRPPTWAFRLYQVFTFLAYSNSMLNPLLYAFTNEYFRDAFRGAFKCVREEGMSTTSRRTSALQCIESAGNICQQLEARFDNNGQVLEQQNMVTSVTTEDVISIRSNSVKTAILTKDKDGYVEDIKL